MRLTKNTIEKLLEMNDGFTRTTSYSSRNYKADWKYIIDNGKVIIEKFSKTSWADSRYTERYVANIEETRRFLRKYIEVLNTTGLE